MIVMLYTIIINFFIFMLGASLGSFANVIADRYKVKKIGNSRSECMSCLHKLSWYELIPIFSYLIQKGRCRECKSKLSHMYLWSEIFAGVGTLAIFQFTVMGNNYFRHEYAAFSVPAILTFIFWGVIICLSTSILIYDLRHKIVPAVPVYILMGLGTLFAIYRFFIIDHNFYNLFAGLIIALPYTMLYLFSKGKWVGLGDILIYFSFGSILGLALGSTMFFVSVWLGAVVTVALLLTHKNEYTLKSEIPFTPFIIIASIFVYIINYDLLSINYFIN